MRVYAVPATSGKLNNVDIRSYASIVLNGQNSGSILLNAIRFQYVFDAQVQTFSVGETDLPFQLLMRFSAPSSVRNDATIAYNSVDSDVSTFTEFTEFDYSTLALPSFISSHKQGNSKNVYGHVTYELVRNEVIFESDSFPSILYIEIQLLNAKKLAVGQFNPLMVPFIEIQYEII